MATESTWLSDEDLAVSQEDAAKDIGRRIDELTREIKDCEATGDTVAAARKKRLRKLYRRDRKQLLANAATLRASLGDKPLVGIRGHSGAAPMKKW